MGLTIMTEAGGVSVYTDPDKLEMAVLVEIILNIDERLCCVLVDLIDGTKLTYPIREVQFAIYTNGGYSIVGQYPNVKIKHTDITDIDKNIIEYPADVQELLNGTQLLTRIQNIKIIMNSNSCPTIRMILDIADSYHDKSKFIQKEE